MYTYMSYMVTDFFFLHISPQFDLESLFLSFSLFFFFFFRGERPKSILYHAHTYLTKRKLGRKNEKS